MKKTMSLALALCLLVCVGCYGGEQTINNSSAQGGENFVNSDDTVTSANEYSSVTPGANVTSANVTGNTNTAKKPNKTQGSSSMPASRQSGTTNLKSVKYYLDDYYAVGRDKKYSGTGEFDWVIPDKTTARELFDRCPPIGVISASQEYYYAHYKMVDGRSIWVSISSLEGDGSVSKIYIEKETYSEEDFDWIVPDKTTIDEVFEKCPPRNTGSAGHTRLYIGYETNKGDTVWVCAPCFGSTVTHWHIGDKIHS